ncbi:unnamed protein product [Clonostachys rosea f. rosea IK726]|uniref:Uncharacterized protein n=1 Tax=Clonostachys rosea f. rosea IK726 TaxID=1349383 RepID=A0ACA9TNJ7_BIOOC|nr:unnamed protein product [Clonostachys rosea f. rosea IK726]
MGKYEEIPSSDSLESHEPFLGHPRFTVQSEHKAFRILRHGVLTVLVVYAAVATGALVWLGRQRVPQPYTPASGVISYRRQPLYFGEDKSFSGSPDHVDRAWRQLLEPLNIRTSYQEQLAAHAEITDEILQPSDGGYVGVLSVYHELHCLDTLRMNMDPERYYSGISEAEKQNNIVHMTHCVDTIRRSLMCKADPAMYTGYWIANHTVIPSKELRSNSDTICVNWEALDGWARERLLPADKYKVKPGPFENQMPSGHHHHG